MRSRDTFGLSVLIVGLLATASLSAGEWEPRPDLRYRLEVRDARAAAESSAERAWVASLVRNLKAKGGKITAVEVFARSSARLFLNDAAVSDVVYVSRTYPMSYLKVTDTGQVLVDFRNRIAYMPCCGGLSTHIPASKQFVVFVMSAGTAVSGIPIQGPVGDPTFDGDVVEWY